MDCAQHNHEETVVTDVALLARFASLHESTEFNAIRNKNKDFIMFSSFTIAVLSVGSL